MAKIKFENGIPESIRHDIESVYNEFLEYYKDTEYNPPTGICVDIGDCGRYSGRDENGNAIIELDEKEINDIPLSLGTFIHENAHDVGRQIIFPRIGKSSCLLSSTLDEMFADLNTLYFGYPIGLERNPFDEEYERAFKGLSDALSLNNRKREIELVRKILEEIEKNNREKILEYSTELNRIPPSHTTYIPNMFVYYINQTNKISRLKNKLKFYSELFSDKEKEKRFALDTVKRRGKTYHPLRVRLLDTLENDKRYKKALKVLEKIEEEERRVWKKKKEIEFDTTKKLGCYDSNIGVVVFRKGDEEKYLKELENNQEYQALEKRYRRLSKVENKLYKFIEEKIVLRYLDHILKDEIIKKCSELERTLVSYCMLLDYLKNNKRTADFVLRSVESEKYGENREESMDFPHDVGGALAKKLYAQDVTPKDVIDSPEKYLELCKKEIERVIEDWLEKFEIYQAD